MFFYLLYVQTLIKWTFFKEKKRRKMHVLEYRGNRLNKNLSNLVCKWIFFLLISYKHISLIEKIILTQNKIKQKAK